MLLQKGADRFHLNELLMKLLVRHDAHALLFDAYERALRELALCRCARRNAASSVHCVCSKTLLDEIGYGLVLDHEVVAVRRSAPVQSMIIIPTAARWMSVRWWMGDACACAAAA